MTPLKFLAALAVASLAAGQTQQGALPQSETDALIALSQAFTSSIIVWNTSLPLCNQPGISCTSSGGNGELTVTQINLSNGQVQGTLPSAIGDLGNLNTLILRNNQISGTIPPQIADLASLITLDLSLNKLIGTIPSNLKDLQQLQYLNVANNTLTGSFPADFPLGNLQTLRLLGTNTLCPYPNYTSVPVNDWVDSSNCQVCNQNSCLNGGQCVASQDQSFQCTCPQNIQGQFCEITAVSGEQPSDQPSETPSDQQPSEIPSDQQPSETPSDQQPSDQPSEQPSATQQPSQQPSQQPTDQGDQGGQGTSAGQRLLAGVAPLALAALAGLYAFV